MGKRVAGLRVVAIEDDLTRGRVAARTVFRLIDGLALYAVAIASILLSRQNQRLGDRVAGTRVVRA